MLRLWQFFFKDFFWIWLRNFYLPVVYFYYYWRLYVIHASPRWAFRGRPDNGEGFEVWKFIIVVFLLLPELGPLLNDELVKETYSVFCLAFLDSFWESHEKSVQLPQNAKAVFALLLDNSHKLFHALIITFTQFSKSYFALEQSKIHS